MSEVAINYKSSAIATMDASGTKTLLTEGKYCEDDIEVVYTRPQTGADIPTFTVVFDDSWENVISATCDKTFAECYALASDGNYSALAVMSNQSQTYEATDGLAAVGVASSSLDYHMAGAYAVAYMIINYLSDNTINVTVEPFTITQLSVASNGTYSASDTFYDQVTVSVPTGTARTASDITVSGATVTVPAGLYSSQASKSVASMTLPSATSLSPSGSPQATFSPNTAAHRYINIPIGYNATSKYYALEGMALESKTIEENGTYIAFEEDLHGYSAVTVNVPQPYMVEVYWDENEEAWLPYATYSDMVDNIDNLMLFSYEAVVSLKLYEDDVFYYNVFQDLPAGEESPDGKTYSTDVTLVYSCQFDSNGGTILDLYPYQIVFNESTSVTPTESQQVIEPNWSQYTGLSQVTVGAIPSAYIIPSGTSTITSNGIYDVTAFASASVSVAGFTPIGTYSVTSNGIYDITSYASVDVQVSGGGGNSAEDGIIAKTISGAYENSRVTTIGSYAFYYCKSLTTASFPSVTSIGNSAFYYCTSLTTTSFPSAISIGSSAFNNCALTTASFPSVTSIGGNAFNNCTKLTTASFPSAISIGGNAFYNCTKLTTTSFPSVTSIGGNAFQYCTSLTTASFPNAKDIGNQAFRNCSKLESLYVLSTSMATLGTSAFLSTPMSLSSYLGHFGSIYVPSSLVASYQTATNWNVYAARIASYVG